MNALEKICERVERRQKEKIVFIMSPLLALLNVLSALFILWAILNKE